MSSILKTISFCNVINAPAVRNDNTKLLCNSLRHEHLTPNRHLNRSPEFFKQDAQHYD